eukprot:2044839-Rhodomonas_salina.2
MLKICLTSALIPHPTRTIHRVVSASRVGFANQQEPVLMRRASKQKQRWELFVSGTFEHREGRRDILALLDRDTRAEEVERLDQRQPACGSSEVRQRLGAAAAEMRFGSGDQGRAEA